MREKEAIVKRLIQLHDEWREEEKVTEEKYWEQYFQANNSDFCFLLAAILDRGMVAERAWSIPDQLASLLGLENNALIEPQHLENIHLNSLESKLREAGARYPKRYAKSLKLAARKIIEEYDGNASLIYDCFSAREVYLRLIHFHGIGPKIAAMLVRFYSEDFEYDYYDMEFLDLPGDIHNARVFYRLGLTENESVKESRTAAALLAEKEAYKLDSTFEIGKSWCSKKTPLCDGDENLELGQCPLYDLCPWRN